jgi:hypothetical protein
MDSDKRIGRTLADQSAVGGEGIDTRSASSAQAPTVGPRSFVNMHYQAHGPPANSSLTKRAQQ